MSKKKIKTLDKNQKMCYTLSDDNRESKSRKQEGTGKTEPTEVSLLSSPVPSPFLDLMYRGYFPLWRKITDWGWYKEGNTARVFIHLLLKMNFTPRYYMGKLIKPGQVAIGRKQLSVDLGLSESQVRTALKHLKSTSEITTEATSKFSVITIVNYKKYLPDEAKKKKKQPAGRPSNSQHLTTTYNDNNDINNIYIASKDKNTPLETKKKTPLQEVVDYYFGLRGKTDKVWIKLNYSRHTRAAKNLLELARGDAGTVKKVLAKAEAFFKRKNLDWTLDTVVRWWDDIKADVVVKSRYVW